MAVSHLRLRRENDAPERAERDFVLYWCTGARRSTHNFALDHALALSERWRKPLYVLEPLRLDYPWAGERFHAFVMEGMRDNQAAFARAGVRYHPYVEPTPRAGRGLVEELGRHACVVVTDQVPGFFLPRAVRTAARRLDVALVSVDSNGLLPLAATDAVFTSALAFRRVLQRELPRHLLDGPAPRRAASRRALAPVPPRVAERWPATDLRELDVVLGALPLDRSARRTRWVGGSVAARAQLQCFVHERLPRYAEDRSHPDLEASSGLSPWLHFGHLSAHEVFGAVTEVEGFSPMRAGGPARGQRQGFWGMSASAEAFLDQLITWRELGLHTAAKEPGFDQYAALPAWARATLAERARDPRPALYSLEELADARTHDELWNAAQRQLVREGVLHNYLRMLWGKKVLEWSPTPEEAYARLLELNHRFALDGRDANSVAGIQWCFGRYDRPWGPRRPVFGVVRYMTSASARRKLWLERYLERFSAPTEGPRRTAPAHGSTATPP